MSTEWMIPNCPLWYCAYDCSLPVSLLLPLSDQDPAERSLHHIVVVAVVVAAALYPVPACCDDDYDRFHFETMTVQIVVR